MSSTCMSIYLDNNATTMMPAEVIATMNAWLNQGNPSSGYASAAKCREMMRAFRRTIAAEYGFILADEFDASPVDHKYRIIFTSCASESNATIINMTLEAYRRARPNMRPHVITSQYEHKSILVLLHNMRDAGHITLTEIAPRSHFITPDDVAAAIGPATALVTIMHANNELGCINDIAGIAQAAHAAGVPFHTDAAQTFGKYPVNGVTTGVGAAADASCDAISVSFHKLLGPPGIGALILREKFLCGYKLKPVIAGTQNYSLRGGTENVPYIAAAYAGFRITRVRRDEKNARTRALKGHIMQSLRENFPTMLHAEYIKRPQKRCIVFLSGLTDYMCGTLLLSVVRVDPPAVCNVKLREVLESMNIIVGIGSACNTSSKKASHVLSAIGADKYIKAGTLRISLGDDTTLNDVNAFLDKFIPLVRTNLLIR